MAPPLAQDELVSLAQMGAESFGLPASLVYAMIMSESTGKPDVVHETSGAKGLMQLMPPTAQEQGLKPEEMLDPRKNVQAGSGYLAQLLQRFGDPRLALSAYNAGPGATRRQGDIVPATRPYVEKISGIVDEVTQPGQPFAREAVPEFNVVESLDQQRIAKTLSDLLSQPEGWSPPMVAPTTPPPRYSQAGIGRMLSAYRFNE